MHLALIISSLGRGGAERVISVLAGHWARQGRRVSLITLGPAGNDAYPLAPGVERHGLDLLRPPGTPLRAVLNNIGRWRALRGRVRALRPDVVISFVAETNVLTLSACRRFGVPILVAERIDPARHSIGRLRHRLRRALYPRAHAVVVQTEAARVWIHERIPGARARIIPNPALAPHDDSREPQWRPQGGRWVVGMGRLTRQKGFDLLLRAFARCCRARPEWSLAILGEGEERSRLEALAGELGVAPRVMLPGAVPRPAEILRRADLFVLSSRFEGFPNALLEAMACGVASIAADCPSGPAEILDSGRDGVLVPAEDTDALTEAMERLMGDEAQRRALGVRATGVTQRFSLERVAGMWEALLAEASLRPASRSLLA